jgi:ATP-binding cassette subfamily B (MDR/TAP) protein 1
MARGQKVLSNRWVCSKKEKQDVVRFETLRAAFIFSNDVCLLEKSLYGLKQAPKEWNSMLHQYLNENGFNRNWKDYGLYWKTEEMEIILILVYVDDVLIIGPTNMVKEFIEKLKSTFKVKELGRVSKLLGRGFQYSLEETIITQKKYKESILRRLKMEDANPASTPMEMKLSRFSSGYGKLHWNYLKRVLRYLKGSQDYCLRLDGANARNWLEDEHFFIEVFADAAYNNGTDGKSVTGFVTFLNGQFVSGRSVETPVIQLATNEQSIWTFPC